VSYSVSIDLSANMADNDERSGLVRQMTSILGQALQTIL
jgi:hypothetical protein